MNRIELEIALASGDLYFYDVDFSNEDLSDMSLTHCSFVSCNFAKTNLSGADLSYTEFSDCNLDGADLSDANIFYTGITRSTFNGVNLTNIYMNWEQAYDLECDIHTDLSVANWTATKEDIFKILAAAPKHVPGIRSALIAGRIEGNKYYGECACLIGTISNLEGCHSVDLLADIFDSDELVPNFRRPAEVFFQTISRFDDPTNSAFAKLALSWLDEWSANHDNA